MDVLRTRFFSGRTITLLLIFAVAAVHLLDDPTNRIANQYKQVSKRLLPVSVIVMTEGPPSHFHHGAGTVISPDGYILTANHVVISTHTYTYRYNDLDTIWAVKIVARFPSKDIAILKLEDPPDELRWARIGDSRKLARMDPVITVGHPRQCWWTVSTGRINNLYEMNERNVLQIDVVAAPGSSGGGIFNMRGELVGVFQAKIVFGPPFPPDGQLNVGIESADLLDVIDIFNVIQRHRNHGTITIGIGALPVETTNKTPGTYLPMPDLNTNTPIHN